MAISAERAMRMHGTPTPHHWLLTQAALILVWERFGKASSGGSGGGSQWATYAAALPPPPLASSPLFWTPQQLEMIKGTQLMESVASYT